MFNQKILSTKRLSLISIGLLTLSLFLLISTVSAQTDNWQTAPSFATANNNLAWQLAPNQPAPQLGEYVWVIPVENNTPLTPAPEPDNTWTYIVLGASVFFVLLTTVNLVKTKHIKINKGATLLTVCLLSISMFTILPMTAADQTAKTGYKLATPTGEWDYQIRNYTDSTYGVVRGSDWANLMTYVGSSGDSPITPPWAGFTDDAEAVWDAIFSTIEYGVVYGKEVAPVNASGLDVWQSGIPDNVEVVSSYQGNEYKFTNPTNTAGSPYTVSVGAKVMDGYYTAEDSKGRILWSSTNASETIQNAVTIGGRIHISRGVYSISTLIIVDKDETFITGDGAFGDTGTVLSQSATNTDGIFKVYRSGTYVDGSIFRDMRLEGNWVEGRVSGTGIILQYSWMTEVSNCWIHNFATAGISTGTYETGSPSGAMIHHNSIQDNKQALNTINLMDSDIHDNLIGSTNSLCTGSQVFFGKGVIRFHDNHVWNYYGDILQFTGPAQLEIMDNHFEGATQVNKCAIIGYTNIAGGGYVIPLIIITGNIFQDYLNSSMAVGIYLNADQAAAYSNVTINNNYFGSTVTKSLSLDKISSLTVQNNQLHGTNTFGASLTTTKITGNSGFVTENSMKIVAAVNGQTIPHGLSGAPTSVSLSGLPVNDTQKGLIFSTMNNDATNIYLRIWDQQTNATYTGSITVYVAVTYKP